MADFYIQNQTTSQNRSYDGFRVSGNYGLISKNSNINLEATQINKDIFLDKSKIVLSSSSSNKIYSTNNSFIYDKNNLNNLNYKSNNSIINFPNGLCALNPTISDSILKTCATIKSFSNSSFLNYLSTTVNNEKKNLNQLTWVKRLSNNGHVFQWYGNTLNDFEISQNIGDQIQFNCSSLTNVFTLNQYINKLPKNLHGKTLILKLKNLTTTNSNILTIKSFFNGNIKIISDNTSTSKNINFKIQLIDLQNVEIDSITFIPDFKDSFIIKCKNVKNVLINNCTFFYQLENAADLNGNKDIDTKSGGTIQQLLNNKHITQFNYKEQLYNAYLKMPFKVFCIFYNSNAFITNSKFINCGLLSILGVLNSKIISYRNKFKYLIPISNQAGLKKIAFYGIANTKIDSSQSSIILGNYSVNTKDITETYIYNEETDTIENLFKQQKLIYDSQGNTNFKNLFNLVNYCIIYGYAHPGSFFNHIHKPNLLKILDYENKDSIKANGLPIGSMYELPSKYIKNFNSNQFYNQNSNTYLGNYVCNDVLTNVINIGNTYPVGKYNFSEINYSNKNIEFQTQYSNYLKDVKKINLKGIIPIQTYKNRYQNPYIENLSYFYLFKWHFALNSFPYFDKEKRYLSCSIPKSVYNNFFINTQNTTSRLTIQYCMFPYFNKDYYFVNKNANNKKIFIEKVDFKNEY